MALLHFVGNGVWDGKEGLTVPLKKCPIKPYSMENYLIFKFRKFLNHVRPYKDVYQDRTADHDLPKRKRGTQVSLERGCFQRSQMSEF